MLPSPGLPRELVTASLDDPHPPPRHTRQASFDDLGTPLSEVTFCVVDLETTGTDRESDAITEIGAVRYRGGERLRTLQTLVNPGVRIPAEITVMTGITQAMVVTAPRIDQVLSTLWDFIGDSVVVGHNVGFDLGFLAA
ncbi:MAG TPA: endonuclease, partial [Acidimicrobiales bacterium]|nr:endonuclease [Acidimicrobiales bacterium]